MAVPQRELRVLFQRSGNRCAFPDCWRLLIAEGTALDSPVVIGEVAHIIAERPDGPRGASPLSSEQRNKYDNLILLCHQHHQLIDDQPNTYTVARLRAMRRTHEQRVEKALRQGIDGRLPTAPPAFVTDKVYSTLLPITQTPAYIFGSPCSIQNERELRQYTLPTRQGQMAPAILRGGMLYSFQNLCDPDGPFRDVVDLDAVERYPCADWWGSGDKEGWFLDLANRALNKLTGRLNLNFDYRHRRYFFQPEEAGQEVEITYQPLNQRTATRTVVWQPKSKRTGEGRGYWFHRAVSLRMLRIGQTQWCMSIRPELHVTTDGIHRVESEKVGSKVTKKKSHMFNYDLLSEVQFWRDYLSGSSPRIIMRFGPKAGQRLIVSTTLMAGSVTWPGIPKEHDKPFKNIEYLDNLFTWAEYAQAENADSDDAWDAEDAEDEWGSESEVDDGNDD